MRLPVKVYFINSRSLSDSANPRKDDMFLGAVIISALFTIPFIRFFWPMWFPSEMLPFDPGNPILRMNRTIHFYLEPIIPPTIEVLVVVNSIPSEVQLRADIRASWANNSYYDPSVTSVVFIMGRPNGRAQESIMLSEHSTYQDILIADVEEDYYMLSVKTYAMLYYKMTRFPNTKCLVKADSDNILNLHSYERLCEELVAPRIVGSCRVDTTVQRSQTKWAVPYSLYPYDRWPLYCSTGTYVIAGVDAPKRMIAAVESTPFLNSPNFRRLPEDVLFTGVFADAAGIPRRDIGGMSFRDQPQFLCRNGKTTYSIHMHRKKKDPKAKPRQRLSIRIPEIRIERRWWGIAIWGRIQRRLSPGVNLSRDK